MVALFHQFIFISSRSAPKPEELIVVETEATGTNGNPRFSGASERNISSTNNPVTSEMQYSNDQLHLQSNTQQIQEKRGLIEEVERSLVPKNVQNCRSYLHGGIDSLSFDGAMHLRPNASTPNQTQKYDQHQLNENESQMSSNYRMQSKENQNGHTKNNTFHAKEYISSLFRTPHHRSNIPYEPSTKNV